MSFLKLVVNSRNTHIYTLALVLETEFSSLRQRIMRRMVLSLLCWPHNISAAFDADHWWQVR